ncbi:MAG: Spy/CpxP family protein refolding chaperone [Gemmatimonadota bacterium]
MKTSGRSLGALALIALLSAGTATAQDTPGADAEVAAQKREMQAKQHMHRMQAMQQEREMQAKQRMQHADPMMGVEAFAPPHLLQRGEVLGLSDKQVQRLKGLAEALGSAHETAEAQARAHHEQLMQAWKAERPDPDALEAHARAAMSAQQDAHVALLRAAAEARGILTPEQRGRVQGWIDARMMMSPRAGRSMEGRERMERMRHRMGDHDGPDSADAPDEDGGR